MSSPYGILSYRFQNPNSKSNFLSFHFQKTQTLKVHIFLISNRNEMIFYVKIRVSTRRIRDYLFCIFFFPIYFKFLYYFLYHKTFSKVFSQIHISHSIFKTLTPDIPKRVLNQASKSPHETKHIIHE